MGQRHSLCNSILNRDLCKFQLHPFVISVVDHLRQSYNYLCKNYLVRKKNYILRVATSLPRPVTSLEFYDADY